MIILFFLSLFFCPKSFAADSTAVAKPKSPIYGGTTIKFDIASPIITSAVYNWKMQNYELAANVQLARRFYPTLELGYAGGQTSQGDSIYYNAHGGFFRVGCDVNPLKKHPESPHALLLGIRIGTGIQQAKTDCWGEIVVGCQVEICKHFYMGWMGRLKILFTRESSGLSASEMGPIYIPGFGSRGDTAWGLSYHLGVKF